MRRRDRTARTHRRSATPTRRATLRFLIPRRHDATGSRSANARRREDGFLRRERATPRISIAAQARSGGPAGAAGSRWNSGTDHGVGETDCRDYHAHGAAWFARLARVASPARLAPLAPGSPGAPVRRRARRGPAPATVGARGRDRGCRDRHPPARISRLLHRDAAARRRARRRRAGGAGAHRRGG